jgi:DNA replication and repair protein RecF
MINGVFLKNVRSFNEGFFEFNEHVNIIVGPNGSGKTTLIEALHIAAKGKSFKAEDKELIRIGESWLRIETTMGDKKLVFTSEYDEQKQTVQRKYLINTVSYRRFPQKHKLPVVVFEPQHIGIVTGEPERRREFLDTLLSQTDPYYEEKLNRYKRALHQRNRLLKQGPYSEKLLFVWDVQLADLGVYIAKKREQFVAELKHVFTTHYQLVSGSSEAVEVEYCSTVKGEDLSAQSIMIELKQTLEKDLQLGFTTKGPHKDDIAISINDRDARKLASRGEARSLLLALKIIEVETIEKALGMKPLLLLDDVFGELDARRRRHLAAALKHYQSFITTTDADVITDHFSNNHTHIIPIQTN